MSEEQPDPGLSKWLAQRMGVSKPSVTEPEMMSHKLIILVEPVAVSYIRTKYGIAPSSETVKFQNSVRKWLRTKANLITDRKTAIRISIWFYFRPPQYIAKLKELPDHIVKPDLDNLEKTFIDCLKPYKKRVNKVWTLIQDGVIPDDAQINEKGKVKKAYTRKTPRIVCVLEYRKHPPEPTQETLL